MERQKGKIVASKMTRVSSKNVQWTMDMDVCLCNFLVDQIHRGGKIDGKFITNAWKEVVQNFNTLQMTNLTRENFKSRMRTWKKTYRALSEISSKSGFQWNPTSQCFMGEPSDVDAFYRKHNHLMPYKNKKFPLYEKFLIIFGKDVATGSGAIAGDDIYGDPVGSHDAHTPGSIDRRTSIVSDGEDMLDSHHIDLNEDERLENIEARAFEARPGSTPYRQSRVRPSLEVMEPRQQSKRRKQGIWERMADSMDIMINVMEKLGSHVETLASKYKTNDNGKTDEERMDRVCKYVSEIPNILPDLIYPTIKYIMADDMRASMFLGLHAHLRQYWLQDNFPKIAANAGPALSCKIPPSSSTVLVVPQSSGSAPLFAAPLTRSAQQHKSPI